MSGGVGICDMWENGGREVGRVNIVDVVLVGVAGAVFGMVLAQWSHTGSGSRLRSSAGDAGRRGPLESAAVVEAAFRL